MANNNQPNKKPRNPAHKRTGKSRLKEVKIMDGFAILEMRQKGIQMKDIRKHLCQKNNDPKYISLAQCYNDYKDALDLCQIVSGEDPAKFIKLQTMRYEAELRKVNEAEEAYRQQQHRKTRQKNAFIEVEDDDPEKAVLTPSGVKPGTKLVSRPVMVETTVQELDQKTLLLFVDRRTRILEKLDTLHMMMLRMKIKVQELMMIREAEMERQTREREERSTAGKVVMVPMKIEPVGHLDVQAVETSQNGKD